MTQTSQDAMKNESVGIAFSNNAVPRSPGIPVEPLSLGYEGGRRPLPTSSASPTPCLSALQVCDSYSRSPLSVFSPSSVPPTTTLPASLAWWSGSARPLDLGSFSSMMSPTMASPAWRPWLVSRWVPAPRSTNSFQGLFSSLLVPISLLKAPCLPKDCPHPEHLAWWSDQPQSHLIIPICP